MSQVDRHAIGMLSSVMQALKHTEARALRSHRPSSPSSAAAIRCAIGVAMGPAVEPAAAEQPSPTYTLLRRPRMRTVLALVLAASLALGLAGSAAADEVFHTERLALQGVSGAPGGGMVVDVHANGPNVYTHEIYSLSQAVPGTYQVFANLYPASLDCSGTRLMLPTAKITTNAVGNGLADVFFTPEMVGALRGSTLSISWTVTGPATYVTSCTIVTLD
jgi:hypothetical protein